LLSYPIYGWSRGRVKHVISNQLFASHRNNPFFLQLNKDILAALKENDGYFGDILKGIRPGSRLFPTSELVGVNAFNRAIKKMFPEINTLLDYIDTEKSGLLYYKGFEEARNYFFPLQREY
jgi:hypothetical protein